jgi:tetratricopeptide (TPR) repeat protein
VKISLGIPAFLIRPLPAALLILLAGIIVYSNSFQVPFVLDDKQSIVVNSDIRSLDNFHASPTRVVGYLTLALNYRFGGLDVTGYHVVNLCIHLVSGLLVYFLLLAIFRTPYFSPGGSVADDPAVSGGLAIRPCVALFAALFFVVHPVQTQAVTYIVQRMTSLATMFYLLSVVLYVLGRLKAEGGRLKAEGWKVPVLLIAGSVISAILAMKTKEIAFTLPLAIVLLELYFFRGDWQRRLLCLLPILATLPIVPLGLLAAGESSGDVLSDVGEHLRASTTMSRLDYLFTQLRVIVTYLRLLVLPINQNLDYDYPIFRTFWTLPVLLSFLFLAALFVLAAYLFWRTRPARSEAHIPPATESSSSARQPSMRSADPLLRLISFGIFWFFLTLTVESSLVPIVDVIFEHRLYLPSAGAAMAFAALFFLAAGPFSRSTGNGLPFLIVACLLVIGLGWAAFQRNHVWGDDVRLWLDAAAKSPQKGRPFNELGAALEDAGRREEAMESFSLAIALDPSHYKARYNLADLYLISGHPEKSLPLLAEAIRIKPDFIPLYVKIGAALFRSGRYRDATVFLMDNLDRIGNNAEARFYLGAAYAFQGNYEAARRELAIVARLDPVLARDLAGLLPRGGAG